MKKIMFLLAALLPGVAAAEGDWAFTAKVGTLGVGGEFTTRLTDTANLRFGLNGWDLDSSSRHEGVHYDTTFRERSGSLIGDLYPIDDSIFRISLGIFYNDNKLDMKARPNSGDSYTFQGHTYTGTEIGTLNGQLTFNKASPYIGVGWGSPFTKAGRWSFALDVGALYQGRPKFKLTSTSAVCNSDPTCQADLANQQSDTEHDLRSYRWYPVVSAGAVYRF
ncbi:MAG TPA: hypothetical protein VMC81_09330 [Rhodocyclaceae bacterium]|nr:hypothetical protein [Rhodocyclaceae bacterium]